VAEGAKQVKDKKNKEDKDKFTCVMELPKESKLTTDHSVRITVRPTTINPFFCDLL